MVADWVEVSNHAYEAWKDRRPDGCRLGPRAAWDESELVPTRFWEGEVYAEEVWLHPPTMMLIIVDWDRDNVQNGNHYIKTAYALGGSDWQDSILEWGRRKFGRQMAAADRIQSA